MVSQTEMINQFIRLHLQECDFCKEAQEQGNLLFESEAYLHIEQIMQNTLYEYIVNKEV